MYDAGKWQELKFNIKTKLQFGSLLEEEEQLLMNMKPNVLYVPSDSKFPIADMFWEEQVENGRRKVCGIQVTFASTRSKPLSSYQEFVDRLGLDMEKDELVLYFVTNPMFTQKYAKRKKSSFFEGENSINSWNIKFITLRADRLNLHQDYS